MQREEVCWERCAEGLRVGVLWYKQEDTDTHGSFYEDHKYFLDFQLISSMVVYISEQSPKTPSIYLESDLNWLLTLSC